MVTLLGDSKLAASVVPEVVMSGTVGQCYRARNAGPFEFISSRLHIQDDLSRFVGLMSEGCWEASGLYSILG